MATSSQYNSVTILDPRMTITGRFKRNKESTLKKSYLMFQGIPYAKPPIKKMRFQPPEPYEYDPERDGDPYLALTQRPMATQKNINKRIIGAEDCLYLNLYTPKDPKEITELLPVLVYFHGGGFRYGSGNYNERKPSSMMVHDIIFVPVNYRLGPFGFLNLRNEECQGNAGLKDQVMALRWVKANIAAFGGDPNNVTICGESAGGSCVNFHLISPLSKDLFHKAIIQSGGVYCPWGFTGHQVEIAENYKKHISNLKSQEVFVVKQLIEADVQDILMVDDKVSAEEREKHNYYSLIVHMGPSTEKFPENAFLPPEMSMDKLMRRAKPVPILAGITEQEGAEVFFQGVEFDVIKSIVCDDDNFKKFLMANLRWTGSVAKNHVSRFRERYFPNLDDMGVKEAEDGLSNLCTDLWFHRFYDNYKLGEKGSAPLYVYKFNYMTDINPSKKYRKSIEDAGHGDDLAYLFCPKSIRKNYHLYPIKIQEKIRTMCSLWANFCKSGVPESEHLPKDVKWVQHTDENPCYLLINNHDIVMKNGRMNADRWKFMNDIVQKEPKILSPTSPSFCYYAGTMETLYETFKGLNLESKSVPSEEGEISEPSTSQPETSNLLESSKGGEESNPSTLQVSAPSVLKRETSSNSDGEPSDTKPPVVKKDRRD